MTTSELKRQALGAAFWQVVRTAGDQILRLALFVVMARILTPRDFGIFAVASIFAQYSQVLANAGFSEALVQAQDVDDEMKDTVFWAVAGLTALVAGAVAAGSWLLTGIAGVPEAQPFLLALAGCMMIGPLSAVHAAMSRREFKNKSLTGAELSASVLGGLVAIVGLHLGFGLWSLILQMLVGGLVVTVLTWRIYPWVPQVRFSRRRLRDTWRFSGNMLLARIMQMSVGRVQDLLAARFLGPAPLGQFRVAGRALEFMNNALIGPLSTAALPVLARLQDNEKAFHNAYGRMIALACLGCCPAAFGFAAVADDAVPMIFGERWLPAIPALQVLALLAPANALAYFSGPALSARGRPDVMVRVVLIQLIGTTIFSLAAVPYGIVALAAAYVLRSYLTLPLQLWMFSKATGMKSLTVLSKVAPSTLASLVMVVAIVMARSQLADWAPLYRLLALTALGGAVYAAVLALAFRPFVKDQLGGLRDIIRSRSKP